MFHPASATSFPSERAALLFGGKIRFARYRSVGLAAAQTDCLDRHFSLSATFLLCGLEIVAARKARGQSQLRVRVVGPEPNVLRFQECQEIGIDSVGLSRGHA